MSTTTRTGTETTTITAGDVRHVMRNFSEEINYLCNTAAKVARDFDADSAVVDCSLLALNDIVSRFCLQFYLGKELVREYSYRIACQTLEPSGPAPNKAPTGSFPAGTRVRLVAHHNLRVPEDVRNEWFRRLGWKDVPPLECPPDVLQQRYGAFASGGFGLERHLLINPKYDRPMDPVDESDAPTMGKGG